LFKTLSLRVPGTLTHHPLFVIGSLFLTTPGINKYSSRKLLVNGSPSHLPPKLNWMRFNRYAFVFFFASTFATKRRPGTWPTCATTTGSDHQYAAISLCDRLEHTLLTAHSLLQDLLLETHFQPTSGTFTHTLLSVAT